MLGRIPALAVAGVTPLSNAAENPKLLALGGEHSRALLDIASYIESLGGADIPEDYQFPDDEVARRMVHVPALTLAGLAIKAKAYAHTSTIIDALNPEVAIPKEHWSVREQLLHSLLRDILALA